MLLRHCIWCGRCFKYKPSESVWTVAEFTQFGVTDSMSMHAHESEVSFVSWSSLVNALRWTDLRQTMKRSTNRRSDKHHITVVDTDIAPLHVIAINSDDPRRDEKCIWDVSQYRTLLKHISHDVDHSIATQKAQTSAANRPHTGIYRGMCL